MSKSLTYITIGAAVLVVAVFVWVKFPHHLFSQDKNSPREPMEGPTTSRPGLGLDASGSPVSFVRGPLTNTQINRRRVLNT